MRETFLPKTTLAGKAAAVHIQVKPPYFDFQGNGVFIFRIRDFDVRRFRNIEIKINVIRSVEE